MKYMPIFGVLALSACGVNSIPETSDIKTSLKDQMGECKYVKISDVKKINGRDLGSGRYAVEQEFELEILPESKYEKDVDRVTAAGPLFEKVYDDFKQGEVELYAKYKQDMASVPPDDMDRYEQQRKAQLQKDLFANLDAQKAKLAAAGFVVGPNENLPNSTAKFEGDLLRQMIQGFDGTCNQIKWPGKAMVLQVAGLNPYKQMLALAKGTKGKLTETVTYTKTEKGWIRQ